MRDFPPIVTSFWSPEGAQPLGEPPDTRSPLRSCAGCCASRATSSLVAIVLGVLWQLPLIVGPMAVRPGDRRRHRPRRRRRGRDVAPVALLVVTLIGAVFGIALHTLVVRSWLISLYGTTMMVTRKAAQMGHVLPRRSPTGEILSVASSDSDEFGAMTEIIARAGSQLVSFLAVAAIVLATSPRLGVVVLVAAPILVGVALPFLRPLHRRQEVERSRNSELTSMATDIVAGLRILRGIGGERTFGRNYAAPVAERPGRRASRPASGRPSSRRSACCSPASSWCCCCGSAPARCSPTGSPIGELISFLGYGLYLIGPIRTFFEFAQKVTRAMVSARKAIAIFEPEPPWREPDRARRRSTTAPRSSTRPAASPPGRAS